ncbi:MAG: hypothetical protein Q4F95_07345 [Oscillospiraceae bacterium]|nr:hypothetical protein [Oscillospiraceae bacterium]
MNITTALIIFAAVLVVTLIMQAHMQNQISDIIKALRVTDENDQKLKKFCKAAQHDIAMLAGKVKELEEDSE